MPEGKAPQRQSVTIGIGGPSGSGKTSLARELARQLHATLFPMDVYYPDLGHLSQAERAAMNFDAPESLDLPLMAEQLRTLRGGAPVRQPVYDFSAYTRVPGRYTELQPRGFIVVEGILALHFAAMLPLYSLRVYVDTPEAVCFERRLERDVRERGRTESVAREQMETKALPMARRYVLPSQRNADVTVSGNGAMDWAVEAVLSALRERGLLPGGGSGLRG